MPKRSVLDKFHDHLFEDFDQQPNLTPVERKQIERYRAVFTIQLENPSVKDISLRRYLMKEYGISNTQAFIDIQNVRLLLGNVRNASKEWMRYLVNETLKSAIEDAKAMGEPGLALMINAADKLGRYNRLDKDDSVEMPWDEIIPQSIEPTNDPTVLNVKPLKNKKETIQKLYEKYREDIEIEDVDYEVDEK